MGADAKIIYKNSKNKHFRFMKKMIQQPGCYEKQMSEKFT
jgi:hypothetical protein